MSDQAQTRFAPEESPARRLLSFITAHFAIFSLLGLLLFVLCSTLFLYGYLSVFDWQLIWIIEYTDILKFGLVVLAVASGIFFFVLALITNLITNLPGFEGKTRLVYVGVIIALVFAAWAIPVVIEWRTEAAPRYEMYVSLGTSTLLLVVQTLWIWTVVVDSRTIKTIQVGSIALGVLLLLVSVGWYGRTFGVYTKYSKGLTNDVFLKDREMTNVRLVLFTSHHTVLYAGTDVVVLPTSEIMKIVAHPADQQRWPDSELY